ncbi:inactive pancreatic lipase-related protein 1-like [Styela clava]
MLSISSSTFDPSRFTRFIVHGYVDNGDVAWLSDMSNAFLAKGNENIIRVGWMGASLQLNYASSAVDTQIVGAEIGNFIKNLISAFGMSPSQFHCVGHSLGSHTCGYAGNRVARLGRITGLDPAGPYFEGTPAEVRLDETDADFVDVIHSDAEKITDMGLGTGEQSGHVDFWPNAGYQQPGCDQNALSTIIGIDGITDGTRDFVACNHIRAVKFFTESITTTCPFKSYPCLSYNEFLAGKCLDCDSTGCPQMGYHADKYASQVYKAQTYLSTNALPPFCEYMSDVGVRLGSNSKSIDGSLYLTLYGASGNTEQQQIGGADTVYELRPGGYHSSLVYYDYNPGTIDYVKLLWEQQEINVGRDYITIDYVTVWVGATQQLLCFGGDPTVEMSEKTRYTLSPISCY